MKMKHSEMSDAERRRRLASVYRLLIELGQRGNGVVGGPAGEQESEREKTAANL